MPTRPCACCVRWLLMHAAEAGRYLPQNPADPAQGCGMVVLALGKHGARELNYSSDIDVVVFFDPRRAPLAAACRAWRPSSCAWSKGS